MKNKEKHKRLSKAKTTIEQLALAKDAMPGGRFDEVMADAILALQVLKDPKANIQCQHERAFDWKTFYEKRLFNFGRWMAEAMERGDSNLFRDLAETIDTWREHEPSPDKRLAAFFEAVRLHESPPELTPTQAQNYKAGKVSPLTVLEIITHMQAKSVVPQNLDLDAYNNLAHTVRAWGKTYRVKICGCSGRPNNRDATELKTKR